MFKKKGNETTIVERRPKKKIKAWMIILAVVVLLIVFKVASSLLFGGKEQAAAMVDATPAEKGTVTSTLDTSGAIASEVKRVYASPVNATVGSVPIEIGQSVKKGDYLLTYNTDSLEKSYNIAELQAKAEESTSGDLLSKNSKVANELTTSASDEATLQGQVDALNAELASLRAQATQIEIDANGNTATNGEITQLKAELETVIAQMAEYEKKIADQTITDAEKEKLSELKKTKKSLEKSIGKKQDNLADAKDIANNATNIQAQITEKTGQLSDLQSKLAEAQGKKTSADASIMTEQAKANLKYSQQAAKLTLEQTADNLNAAKAGLTADFDGIVMDVQAAEGTAAVEGTPLLTLASANDMCIEVPVSKYNLATLELNQKAEVTFQDKVYQGTVSYISKVAAQNESGAAMVNMKIHLDQPDENLIIGLDAKVSVKLGSVENAVLVPVSSVNSDTEGDFVYVVEKGIVVKKYVTIGMSSKEQIEIKSGIKEGEKVITSVDSTIMEGMQVVETPVTDTKAAGADNQAGQNSTEKVTETGTK